MAKIREAAMFKGDVETLKTLAEFSAEQERTEKVLKKRIEDFLFSPRANPHQVINLREMTLEEIAQTVGRIFDISPAEAQTQIEVILEL